MPSNKRPRKRYRPKAVVADPVAWAVEGARPAVDNKPSEWLTARIKVHDALLRLMRGESTRDTLDVLVNALNVSQAVRDVCRIGDEYADEFAAAHAALLAVCRRPGHIGSSSELSAIRDLVELHDAQLALCSVRQFDLALKHIQRQLRHGRATRILEQAEA